MRMVIVKVNISCLLELNMLCDCVKVNDNRRAETVEEIVIVTDSNW